MSVNAAKFMPPVNTFFSSLPIMHQLPVCFVIESGTLLSSSSSSSSSSSWYREDRRVFCEILSHSSLFLVKVCKCNSGNFNTLFYKLAAFEWKHQ
jgi:hypothetical protein